MSPKQVPETKAKKQSKLQSSEAPKQLSTKAVKQRSQRCRVGRVERDDSAQASWLGRPGASTPNTQRTSGAGGGHHVDSPLRPGDPHDHDPVKGEAAPLSASTGINLALAGGNHSLAGSRGGYSPGVSPSRGRGPLTPLHRCPFCSGERDCASMQCQGIFLNGWWECHRRGVVDG